MPSILPDDAGHDWGDWAVPTADGGWESVDAPSYLTWWIKHLRGRSPELKVGFDALVQAGCDRLVLGWFVEALGGAVQWRRISRGKLKHSARALRRAAKTVRELFYSNANSLLDLRGLRLAGELEELAVRAELLAPHAHKHRPLGRDLVRAGLVRYVNRVTGHWHDEHVSALINVGESYAQSSKSADYTAEAHVQWRHRPSCQSFLSQTSPLASRLDALQRTIDESLNPSA